MPIFESIKFRLIALGVLLVILGVSVRLFFALPFAQGLLRDAAATEQLSVASYVARGIDQRIQARHALIAELVASLPRERLQRPGTLADWLRERQRLNPLFDGGLFVVRPDGSGLFAQYPMVAGRDKLDYSNADWFQAAQRGDAQIMSKPQYDRVSGKPILIMAAPILDAGKRVVAVLAGEIELNASGFLDLLRESPLGAGGRFFLISPADKLFVGASDPAMVLTPTPLTGVNPLYDRAMAGYRGTGIVGDAEGDEALSAIASVPGTEWFVVARVPTSQIFSPIHAMRGFVLRNTLMILAGMMLVLMLLLPRILRPLTNAAHAMRDMADGKRQLAPLLLERRDEVGNLVLGFNYLVTRLHEKEAALKASEARLEFMAHNDSLTGLHNRAMLEDRLQQALMHAERQGLHFALLFCDLDDFKPINDQLGHEAGDAVLREVAGRLLQGRRRSDTVARFGGDEFVVLLTDLQDAAGTAVGVAREILAAINSPFYIEGRMFTLAASIGIAVYEGGSVTTSQLMSRADIAMYSAKREGKNRFCTFDEALMPRKE